MSDVETELQEGKMLLERGEFKKAIKKFNDVLKLDPANSEAYFGKAEASLGLPKVTIVEIASDYRNAIKFDAENIFYLTSYGEFCLTNGLLKQAEENYMKAIALDPESSPLYYSDLALGYFKNGNLFLDRQLNMTEDDITRNSLMYMIKALNTDAAKAIGFLADIINNREWTEDRVNTAGIDDEMKELKSKGEERTLSELQGHSPQDPLAYLNAGQFCFDNNLIFLGEMNFLKAIELAGEDGTDFYSDLAVSYYLCGTRLLGSKTTKGLTADQILKNSLKYYLKSLNMHPQKALEVLKK